MKNRQMAPQALNFPLMRLFALAAAVALLVPAVVPAVNHHFAELEPGHSHIYFGNVRPHHEHLFGTPHEHNAPTLVAAADDSATVTSAPSPAVSSKIVIAMERPSSGHGRDWDRLQPAGHDRTPAQVQFAPDPYPPRA